MTPNRISLNTGALALACAALLSGCAYEPIRTTQQTFCANHGLGPNCEHLVARSLWWPDILIENDGSGTPMITCHAGAGGKLQVNARVKNYGWSAGGPFWTQFDATYTEAGASGPSTKTYYVFSGWDFAGLSTSGTSPFVNGGVVGSTGSPFSLAGSAPSGANETDVVVTYESRSTNPAARVTSGQNIAATDAPFTLHVRTNVPDPTNPTAPIANVNTSDRTVRCTAS